MPACGRSCDQARTAVDQAETCRVQPTPCWASSIGLRTEPRRGDCWACSGLEHCRGFDAVALVIGTTGWRLARYTATNSSLPD